MRSSSDAVAAVSKSRILSLPGRFQLDIVELSFMTRLGAKSSPTTFCPGAHCGLLLMCVPKSSFVHDLGAESNHSHGLFVLPVARTAVCYCCVFRNRVLCTIWAPSSITPTVFLPCQWFARRSLIATWPEHDNVLFCARLGRQVHSHSLFPWFALQVCCYCRLVGTRQRWVC